ncbi:MAG: riboflavin synthase [Firmicutes bacterium]|nr:riboflavin synthase [Bacillota bacterium]
MFTGLIKALGTVREIRAAPIGAELKIATELAATLRPGDSVAINGVCLTAHRLGQGWFGADIMPETWRATNLSCLRRGDLVNLEPALAGGEPMGGHLVSGHVDGVGRVVAVRQEGNAFVLVIRPPAELFRFIAPKGSIAVNGVSLTVQAVREEDFTVAIIPHTFRATNLRLARPGTRLNLEVDLLARYLARLEESRAATKPGGITLALLAEHGFIK